MYQVIEYASINQDNNSYLVVSSHTTKEKAEGVADERHDENEKEVEGTEFFNSKIVTVKKN